MERVLVPAELPRLLRAVHDALLAHRDEVDALNVFPVPDGDTGTNLAATAAAVAAAASGQPGPPRAGELSRAALRSARGNSGVIFSQVLRAVLDGVEDESLEDDVAVLAHALSRADELAREAVAAPVEGTILTAVRAAAEVAQAAHDAGRRELGPVLDEVRQAVTAAVAATRDQLDVLREAGVVDAGARGFEVAIVALQGALTGVDVQPGVLDNLVPRCSPSVAHMGAFPIEVQFVLEAGADEAARVREQLTTIGDSVVVVAAEGLVQAHVHTDDPEAALAIGADIGEVQDVRITDLRPALDDPARPSPTGAVGLVAVLPPGGLSDLGAGSGAVIVPGAAGDLPSVQQLLDAARETGAATVLLLPGHPNVVPTARQARALAADEGGPSIEVVGGALHPLVVLACLALQSADLEALDAAARDTRSGEVVAAVRDAELPIGEVVAGQPLVVVGAEVVAVGADLGDALGQLLSHLDASSCELVTIAVGAESVLDAAAVMQVTVTHVGDAELEVLDGGQRPALLLVAVEG